MASVPTELQSGELVLNKDHTAGPLDPTEVGEYRIV